MLSYHSTSCDMHGWLLSEAQWQPLCAQNDSIPAACEKFPQISVMVAHFLIGKTFNSAIGNTVAAQQLFSFPVILSHHKHKITTSLYRKLLSETSPKWFLDCRTWAECKNTTGDSLRFLVSTYISLKGLACNDPVTQWEFRFRSASAVFPREEVQNVPNVLFTNMS